MKEVKQGGSRREEGNEKGTDGDIYFEIKSMVRILSGNRFRGLR